MKILYLHPKAWTGEYPLLRELVGRGHQVSVLEEKRGGQTREASEHFVEVHDGIRTLWYDPSKGAMRIATWIPDRVFRSAFDGRNLVHRIAVIREATKIFNPDVMISSDGFSYGIPAGWSKRMGVVSTPLMITYIGGDILDNAEAQVGHRRTPAVMRLLKGSYAGADVLRPVSPLLEGILLGEGADPDRIRVLPSHLVCSGEVLARHRRDRALYRAEIRRKYAIHETAPVIVTVSGNLKGKGLHLLAETWPRIRHCIPNARWLLCGEATRWLDQAVWPKLSEQSLRDSVVATGRLSGDEVFMHLAAADLHVNPTLCESLNMVTVEAAGVGTPTIGTDGAGISHWMRKHGAGKVVPSGNATALGDAIIFSLKNHEVTDSWGAALPAFVSEFALEAIASNLISALEAMRAPKSSKTSLQ